MLHDYHRDLPGGVTLVPSSGGVLEVTLDERPVFSKKEQGRFPAPEEVLGRLGELLASDA